MKVFKGQFGFEVNHLQKNKIGVGDFCLRANDFETAFMAVLNRANNENVKIRCIYIEEEA